MTDDDDNSTFFPVLIMFLAILILVSLIFEVCIVIYAFTHADSVSCNLLYCVAKSKTTLVKQTCYSNGKMVNCSTIPEYNKNGIYTNENDCFINDKQVDCRTFADKGFDEHFCNNGICEAHGV